MAKNFAYCSTTTIYIYNIENFTCEKILSFRDLNTRLLLWLKTSSNKMIALSSKTFYICDPIIEQFSLLHEFENQPTLADWGSQNENLLAIALNTCFLY